MREIRCEDMRTLTNVVETLCFVALEEGYTYRNKRVRSKEGTPDSSPRTATRVRAVGNCIAINTNKSLGTRQGCRQDMPAQSVQSELCFLDPCYYEHEIIGFRVQ